MLLAIIRRRFTFAVMSVLFLTMFLPLNGLSSTAFARLKPPILQHVWTTYANDNSPCNPSTGSTCLQRIWTTDRNFNDKPSFNPGDAINYVFTVNNVSSQPIAANLFLQVIGPLGRNQQLIGQASGNVTLPSGESSWYAPSTVSTGAIGGTYAESVGVQADTGYDNLNVFTITPVGKLVIPSTGTVTQPFLGSYTFESWYTSYYDQNNNPQKWPSSNNHSGVDISKGVTDCSTSLPVYAAGEGLVIWAGWDGPGFGWSVVVKHGYGFNGNHRYTYTQYGHMGTAGTDPKTSQSCLQVQVSQGVDSTTLVGYQGSSGLSSEVTHVHFTILAGDQDEPELVPLSDPYNLAKKYDTYPASPDFYTCMHLTSGDNNPPPLRSVNYGDNQCS
jgi:murein DD-endopeptidase MepM/ murein hydrolase activator NlpD